MNYDSRRALELLRAGTGLQNAEFRDDQETAIQHIVEERGKLLVVQKTGWGKSFVYFIATKLMREQGSGPSLLISPLLSLMRNQIDAAERMGVQALTINSANVNEWAKVEERILDNRVDILLISPERLANQDFLERIVPQIGTRLPLLIVDEAHCVSDWGHDFRPDYRRIERIVQSLPGNVQFLATTATANNRVMDDLIEILGPGIEVLRGDLNRPSLLLQTIGLESQAERLAWIAERLLELSGSGIIYTLTKRDAYLVAKWLSTQGFDAFAYTSDSENREELELALLENRVKALVATVALGMGFDKPDLAFVIHYQAPGSVVHYYQQVGRAGRQIDCAYGILLSGAEDTEITEFFIRSAFPTRSQVSQILHALDREPGGLTESGILQAVNLRPNRVRQALKLLSLESPPPLVKAGSKWQLTAEPLKEGFWERADRLTSLRYEEQQEMQEYVALESGHMEFLIRTLDGMPSVMQSIKMEPLAEGIDSEMVRRAVEFLKRMDIVIEPRKQWPDRTHIPENQRAEIGRALCYWGDAGWGALVRSGKYRDNRFSDELVSAAVRIIQDWSPQISWVTCIPSLRHPVLVPEFAERLASALRLPFEAVLANTEARPEQKTMENSFQQARNVENSLTLTRTPIDGAVLVIDDMVDSGWTFTVSASLLRSNGCAAVFPFALSDTGSRQG